MFEVLCINNNFYPCNEHTAAYKKSIDYECPQYMQAYTVVAEDKEDGYLEYELAEFPPCGAGAFFWDAEAFVRLNGPDEVEILEERQKEMAECMDHVWNGIVKELDKTEWT